MNKNNTFKVLLDARALWERKKIIQSMLPKNNKN